MGDTTRGLYPKFTVMRTDGRSSPGEKHDDCEYFVLDMTHDPLALPALKTYAGFAKKDYPLLAEDLWEKIREIEAARARVGCDG